MSVVVVSCSFFIVSRASECKSVSLSEQVIIESNKQKVIIENRPCRFFFPSFVYYVVFATLYDC